MLEKIKELLWITGSEQDSLLSFILSTTSQKVKNYCNREDVPEGLELIIVEMVMEQYKSNAGIKDVAAIKRGDTQISYAQGAFNQLTGAGGADFLKNYKAQLNRYRKVGTL